VADGVYRLGKLCKVVEVGAMRKIMTSSSLMNLPASRQIDVGCFKIGLGDNGISRFGGKDYGGLLIQS
jgi:hypothetical protein